MTTKRRVKFALLGIVLGIAVQSLATWAWHAYQFRRAMENEHNVYCRIWQADNVEECLRDYK